MTTTTAPRRLAGVVAPLALALAVFAAVAPTLPRVHFIHGGEDTVIATALVMERGGPVWVPQLHHQDRTRKPPLAAWVAAAGMRPATVAALDSRDRATRDAAFDRLAWEGRWPALAAMGAMLLAVYGLGRVIGGRPLGLASAAVCAGSVLFLRDCRWSTTDVQLALWVVAANYFFASAMLEGRRWTNCLLGGAALGMAFMSKGPVGLVQSALPLLAFAAWRWYAAKRCRDGEAPAEPRSAAHANRQGPRSRNAEHGACGFATGPANEPLTAARQEPRPPGSGIWIGPILGALVMMIAIGLPWYASVLARNPGVIKTWFTEVTREGAIESAPDPWFNYLVIVPFLFPWVLFLAAGLVGSFKIFVRRRDDPDARDRIVLALLLLVLPVVVMSFFKDRKDRYLLPMVGPGAVVAAWGLLQHLRSPRKRDWLLSLHWLMLGGAVSALLVAGAVGFGDFFRTENGQPWFPWPIAAGLAALAGVVFAGAWLARRTGAASVLAATTIVMLVAQAAYHYGLGTGPGGRSEMKPLADAVWDVRPDAMVYSYRADKPVRNVPRDLEIYLSRPVTRVLDPSAVPANESDGRPQVLVWAVPVGEAPPDPGGWGSAGPSVRDEKREWFAYWRDAPSPPPQR